MSRRSNPWTEFVSDYLLTNGHWAQLLRRKFFCSDLMYRDRAYFAAFGFLNGIDPDHLLDILKFCNRHYNPDRAEKIRALYKYWEGSDHQAFSRRKKYYAYNFSQKKVTDLNGDIRNSPTATYERYQYRNGHVPQSQRDVDWSIFLDC